jgi:WD40 repeat protein
MGPCPPVKHLRRLLAGELTAAEEEALDDHLLQCAACCRALESLTASEPASVRSGAADGPAPDPELLRRLKAVAGSLVQVGDGRDRGGGVPADEPRPLPRVPGYEILGELGRGGMGVVYRARQVGLNRVVALKMILGGAFAAGKSLDRFRAEALAVARLQHPNIVQIFETGEAEDLPYFSQEYVEGGTLAAQLDGTTAAPHLAAELCERLARAVQFAHDRGVVHRDLKPANVLLTVDGAPKIADFGLAKNLEDHAAAGTPATETGLVLGTPRYMAPEQLSSSAPGSRLPVGPACDVYALGVILYELLTGRPLYTGATPLDVLVRVLHEDPRPPRAYRPGVPRDLETICLKCLAKAPGGRYATARDLAEDLHRFLVGEPVRARPPSVLDRSVKFVRRHKALVGAAAGIAAALAAGIVATGLTALSEARQRRLADEHARQAGLARQEAVREACQARLAAALAALGGDNVREAADQLEAIPPERRGWEWRYAAARLDDSLAVLRDAGRMLLPCPAGERFVSITDQGVRLWDVAGGPPSAPLTPDVPQDLNAVTTPAGGLVLAVDYHSGFLCVLGGDGRVRQRLTLPGAVYMHAWAFDPAGTHLACAWYTDRPAKEFALFDLADGRQLARFDHVGEEFRCVAFSPDGRRLVTGNDDRLVRVWDAAGGAALQAFEGHRGQINAVAFRPDGRVVLSCSVDQTFRQWDLASGKVVDERYGHDGPVNAVAYSPDGRWIASGGADGTIRYWSAGGGQAVAVLHGHTAAVCRLAFSPDGRRVASVSRDSAWEARVWDGPGRGDPHALRDHTGHVYPVAYSPDGRTIASGAWDREIRLRDASTGQTRAVLRGHEHYVAGLAFSPDNRWLVSRSGDQTIRVWDVATGTARAVLRHHGVGYADAPHGVAVTPDGSRAACVAGDKLYFWELPEGRAAGTRPLPTDSARAVQYSPDGRRLAVVDNGRDVPILDAITGETRVRLRGHEGRVNRVAFSPDGSRLVSAGGDGTVRLWDAATGKSLRIFRGHTDEVFAAVFHPEGGRIASAGRDRVIRIWDPADGAELARLQGHTNYVYSLAFSPDGASLVSGSGDSSVRLWDTFPVARRLQARAPSQGDRSP